MCAKMQTKSGDISPLDDSICILAILYLFVSLSVRSQKWLADLGATEAAVVQPAAVMPDPRPKSASQRLDYADYIENAEDDVLSQSQQHIMAAEPAEQSMQQELQGAESLEPPSSSHVFSQVAENEGSTQQVYSQAVKTSELPAMAQEQPAVAQEQPAVAQDLEPEATLSAQRPSEQGGWFSRSILLPQQQTLRTAKAEELAQHKDVDLEVRDEPLAQVWLMLAHAMRM